MHVFSLEKPFLPHVCLSVSTDPSIGAIKLGDTFTVYCVVSSLSDLEGRVVEMFHININGMKTRLPVSFLDSLGDNYYHYFTTVTNVSENSIGEYVCKFKLETYRLERTSSISMNVLPRAPLATGNQFLP